MRDEQDNPQGTQQVQKGRRWVGWLWPLLFLLIFAFTRSLAGLIVSLAIVIVLEVLIATAPFSPRPGPLPSQPQRGMVAPPPPPARTLLPQMGPGEESDRLAQLKLLGDLHHAGVLTDEEFEFQKRRILQSDTPKEATGAEVLTETPEGEQPQLDYPQELPPMQG